MMAFRTIPGGKAENPKWSYIRFLVKHGISNGQVMVTVPGKHARWQNVQVTLIALYVKYGMCARWKTLSNDTCFLAHQGKDLCLI